MNSQPADVALCTLNLDLECDLLRADLSCDSAESEPDDCS